MKKRNILLIAGLGFAQLAFLNVHVFAQTQEQTNQLEQVVVTASRSPKKLANVGKIVQIITPYDDEIIILNKKLNGTYIYYGQKGSENKSKQYKQDVNAAELNEMVIVNRAISKSSRLYENSTWDLVDALEKKNVDLEKIDKKSLPKELQNKSASELKNFIALKTKERKEIQTKIRELDTKRKKFIATKQLETNEKDVLENVMIQSIKKQALLKNYSW